jgi:predicted nucleotidyltransferase
MWLLSEERSRRFWVDACRAQSKESGGGDLNRDGSKSLTADHRNTLCAWAAGKPTIKALYIFGSYATGKARAQSDLDVALEFIEDLDEPDAELICNRDSWRQELTALTGICVKDIYKSTDSVVVDGPKLPIFLRY